MGHFLNESMSIMCVTSSERPRCSVKRRYFRQNKGQLERPGRTSVCDERRSQVFSPLREVLSPSPPPSSRNDSHLARLLERDFLLKRLSL